MAHLNRFARAVIVLVLIAFSVRLYKITNPIADWHSFRQADTASVTREYVKNGVDFLHPRYHDISNVQSGGANQGRDNLEGWRMVEFPLVNGLLAYLLIAFPFLDLVLVSRLASVVASLASLVFLIMINRKIFGDRVALAIGLFFALLPYSIYYSRAIFPEPFLVALTLGALWTYQLHLQSKKKTQLLLSAVLFALALLVKPVALFFIPVFFALRWQNRFEVKLSDVLAAMVFAVSFLPLILWREWIKQYPLGIPYSEWLFNGGEGMVLSPVYQIRFKPAWWRWIFYERLTKLFLGGLGVIPFGFGFLSTWFASQKVRRGQILFLLGWAISAFLYVSIIAAGNVQHDYYQVPLVPFVSIACGTGSIYLFDLLRKRIKISWAALIVSLIIALSLWFSWRTIRGYYQVNHWAIVHAGKAVDRLVPADAKVIAPYFGDTAFLFQTNRTGWPIGFDIDKKIAEGAQYYVSVNYDDEANELMKKYTVVESTKDYVIVDLTRPANNEK